MTVDQSGLHAACARLAMLASQKHGVPVSAHVPEGHVVFVYTVSRGPVSETLRLAFPVVEVRQNDSIRSINSTFGQLFGSLQLHCQEETQAA